MDSLVKKSKLCDFDRLSDRAYWASKSPQERFHCVELISNPMLENPDYVQQEFSRVYKITYRKRD